MATDKSPPPDKPLVSMREYAKRLGVSTQTVRRRLLAGEIPFYRIGDKTIRIDTSTIEMFRQDKRGGAS